MSTYEAHRSVTAYILVGIAFLGLVIAFLGVTMGFPATALTGGILTLVALIAYSLRSTRDE